MKLAILSGILFVVCIGLVCERKAFQARIAELDRLPSIMEIQERLNEIEPSNPIPVDGKVSPDYQNSLTQAKWDRIVFNRYALVYHDPNHYAKGDSK